MDTPCDKSDFSDFPNTTTDFTKRNPFSVRLCFAWAAQYLICVALVMMAIWALAWIAKQYNRLKPHEKVFLNEENCGLMKNDTILMGRVVNGKVVGDRFPWTVIVGILRYGKISRYGTGALVTPFHVITAAHLVTNPKDSAGLTVLYGSNRIPLMKTVRVIGLRYIDGTLSTRMLNDDIMLVLLEEALRDIPTLCVPPYTHLTNRTDANRDLPLSNVPNEDDNVIIAGFGVSGESGPGKGDYQAPKQLMYTIEKVLENRYCKALMSYFTERTEFCAKTFATGICRGDSGASAMLIVRGRLMSVGIASSTRFCGYSPDRFIKVAAYRKWLHTSVSDSPEKFLEL